jgi:endonuclease/exonuclease/phosphatase family metal-dependent hydrolase
MKYLKRIAGWFFLIVLVILFIGIGFMVYTTLTEYKPDNITLLGIHKPAVKITPDTKDELNILTWNIGYAGLGKEMDFFYEGGKMVRPTTELNKGYLENILNEVKRADTTDFIFIQEVDQRAKRSHFTDQVEAFQNKMNDYYTVFGVNYDVPFVPIPTMEPMGRVKAGQMTLSKMAPDSAIRYRLHETYTWPKRLFLLKRCFIHTQYTLPSGKILSMINLHNSAFGDAVEARKQDLIALKQLMYTLWAKGHYVIAGGDWNQNPPGFDPDLIKDGNKAYAFEHVPVSFSPKGWTWATDPSKATNRDVNEPFVKGGTKATTIDFFIVSPNVSIVSVNTNSNGFVNSDHQPVALKVRLN